MSKSKIKGGLADEEKSKDIIFDKEQLEKGKKVEMEHTDDPEIALEITKDHLVEFPEYYDGLEEMEDKLKNLKSYNLYKKLKKLFSFLVENQEKEAYNSLYKLIKNSENSDHNMIFSDDSPLLTVRHYAKNKDQFDNFIISKNEFLDKYTPTKHIGSGGYGGAFLTADGNVLKIFEGNKNIQEFYEEEINRLYNKDEGSKYTLKIIDHGTVNLPPIEYFDTNKLKSLKSRSAKKLIEERGLMWAVMEYLNIQHDKFFSISEAKSAFAPILDEIKKELYNIVENNTITQERAEYALFKVSNIFSIITGWLNEALIKRLESGGATIKSASSSDNIESLCEYVLNNVYINYIKDDEFISKLFNSKIIIEVLGSMKEVVIKEMLPAASDRLRRTFYDEIRLTVSKYFDTEDADLDGNLDLNLIKQNIKSAIERLPMLKIYINALDLGNSQVDSLINSILERLEQARVASGKLRTDLNSGNIGYRDNDTPVFFDPFS